MFQSFCIFFAKNFIFWYNYKNLVFLKKMNWPKEIEWRMRIQELTYRFFQQKNISQNEIVIFINWSLGRWELARKNFKKDVIDCSIFVSQDCEIWKIKDILQEYEIFMKENGFEIDIDMTNDPSSLLNLRFNKENVVYPSRIIDSFFLYGNEKNISAVLWSLENVSTKEITRLRDRTNFHNKIVPTWKWKFWWVENIYYDIEKWMIHFDPERSIIWIKAWPLRAVQALADFLILRFIQHKKINSSQLMQVWNSTQEKIEFLQKTFEDKNLNFWVDKIIGLSLKEIIPLYRYFLEIHDIAKWYEWKYPYNYSVGNKEDIEEFRKNLNILHDNINVCLKLTAWK